MSYDANEIKQKLLAQIENVANYLLPSGKRVGNNWVAGNVSGEPGKSFNLCLSGEKVGLWYDHATGEGGDIIELWKSTQSVDFKVALEQVGDWLGISRKSTPKKTDSASLKVHPSPPSGTDGKDLFVYLDADRNPLIYVQRTDFADGKIFRQLGRGPDGKGWMKSLKYTAKPRPLYRLPDLLADVESPVCIHEGEKAVTAAVGNKLFGFHTTTVGGSNNSAQTDFVPLAGRTVYICPDNDRSGEEYLEKVADLAYQAGASTVLRVNLPDMPETGDVYDWLEDGGTPEGWKKLLDNAETVEPPTPDPIPEDVLNEAIEGLRDGDAGAHFEPHVIDAARLIFNSDQALYSRMRARVKESPSDARIGDWEKLIRPQQETDEDQNQAGRIVDLVQGKAELFHDVRGGAYASFDQDEHKETWPLNSDGFAEWVGRSAYRELGFAPSDTVLKTAQTTLTGIAKYDGEEKSVFVRCAPYGEGYLIDLGDDGWRAIAVTQQGWKIVENPSIKFIRSSTSTSLPVPAEGNLEAFWEVTNIPERDRTLVLTWILDSWRPDTPYPVLEITGEQGSAKSTTHKSIRQVTDPNQIPLRVSPKNVQDIFVSATCSLVASFENISVLTPGMQDAICTLATGGGFATRRLYSDADEIVLEVKRPVIINGISSVVTRPDLIDRAIHLELPRIGSYLQARELEEKFERARPAIFGALLDLFVKALQELPNVEISDPPRMADFAQLGEAVHLALGRDDSFTELYVQNRNESLSRTLESSPAVEALVDYMRDEPIPTFEGTVKDLFDALSPVRHTPGWPITPKGLSDILRKFTPALRAAGIEVEFLGRSNRGSKVRIRRARDDEER